MANEYPKIQTLFLRDEKNVIMPDNFTSEEFEFLKDCKWECTEKIDGTNIHVDLEISFEYDEHGNITMEVGDREICGRTERAKIPTHLMEKLVSIFTPTRSTFFLAQNISEETKQLQPDWWVNAFIDPIRKSIINKREKLYISVYGEGYGKKIQSCGSRYVLDGTDFILFDVKINGMWLKREACEEIAKKIGVEIVPIIGYMTIPEAMEYVKKGFKSIISQDLSLVAEGLVLKTPQGLLYRNGQRIITKLKHQDFLLYKAHYGDNKVEQTPNPKYNAKPIAE